MRRRGATRSGSATFRDAVLAHIKAGQPLIDVRSPKEFTGEMLHMEDYPQEGSLRGGHIPGAKNVPWSRAVNEDGTFKSVEELGRSTSMRSASNRATTSSPIAGSASAPASPGSS